ncbi:trypsin-like serine protease [Clavibacter sp. VKM Ac-2873]|uniref:trypsin-like serine peptidase n=1 Tax=Clavibacter sp. VKM Ac-2873 TaxID=2783813 RepID=UPI00188C60F7|nr:trypsin-like serine protease [Clavibacter sp. VKM Ac-2873]MBF4619485.1 trypsin-like serine protease [Clavibacter sp. VKM Ac-2873]
MHTSQVPRKRRTSMVIAAVGLGLVLACGPLISSAQLAHAASESSSGGGDATDTGRDFSDADDAASANYWTPERMAAASSLDETPTPPPDASTPVDASAATGVFEPVKWIGRLYFTRDGQDKGCTASSIKSDSKLVIATAAHCLYRDGHFARNLRFIPAWDGANKPLLTWGAAMYQVPREWRYQQDLQHDAAFIQLKPLHSWEGEKKYLADEAGATATNFGLARAGLHYEVFGYELISGYVSHPLLTCSGVGSRLNPEASYLGIGNCAMVNGSSGGPVYHESGRGVNGTQVGVVSSVVRKGNQPSTYFAPWGDVEYQVFRAVDSWRG